MTARVLVVGGVNFDIIAPLDHMPQEHEKVRGGQYFVAAGSAASNTARGIARMGHYVKLIAVIGDDALGKMCLAALHADGVDTRGIITAVGQKTGLAVVFIGNRSKRMVTFPGPECESEFGSVLAFDLSGFDLLHIAAAPTFVIKQIIEYAKLSGCKVSTEWSGNDMSSVATYTDLNFMNSDELASLKLETEPGIEHAATPLARQISSNVIITMGSAGALWARPDGQVVMEPTIPVDPVDRTGGGDAFDAGVIAAHLSGEGPRACLAAGLDAARKTIMKIGA
jgi:sugar/nucleoside kinase (ribokinase family)